MTIPDICKHISQNLTHNLRLAKTDDDRLQYLSLSLTAFGGQVIPPLNQLFALHGDDTPELTGARTAALDLASLICGDLVRKSIDYRLAITSLEEVSDRCSEPQLKQKLVFYTNQIKKRWNVVEPGGLAHNPRAKKIRTADRSQSPLTNIVIILLGIGFMLFVLVRIDLTALIFPAMNRAQQAETLPPSQVSSQEEKSIQPSQESPPQLSARPAGSFYSFADNQGVVHMVDDLDKVPLEYRKNMKVDSPASLPANSTPVFITGNQVVVPVTITFRGRSVETRLLLDTGAGVTTISETLATQLGINATDLKAGNTTVADGRTIVSYRFKADSLAVANHSLPAADTSILPGSGGKGYEGLLGMNYLKNFRYHVNFDKSVIEWGG